MSNHFTRRRRPVLPLLILGAVGLCALVAAGLAVQAVTGPKPRSDLRPPAAIAAPGSSTGIGADGRPATGSSGPLTTIPGARIVQQISVGYPHSPVGAVSAAVHYWSQMSSTLDTARAVTIIQTVADPEWRSAVTEIQDGWSQTRRELGLPTAGPVPAGASVLFTPVMYQVRDLTPDAMSVLLLGFYETVVPGQDPLTRILAVPTRIRWTGGDWKLPAQTFSADYSSLLARPGTPDAATKGWYALVIP